MCCVTGSKFFGGTENEVRDGPLKRTEGGAVDVVDDDGNPGAVGGDASENARFTAVGVDEVRAALAQKSRELAGGVQVEKRMNRADERRNDGEEMGSGDERFQGTFR